jgi:hypothetical protein
VIVALHLPVSRRGIYGTIWFESLFWSIRFAYCPADTSAS